MRRAEWLAVALTAVAMTAMAASACDNSPTAPTGYAPYSQTDLRLGGGAEAVTGLFVTVNYTGWFYDATKTEQKGVQFDSSVGRTPLTFSLGAGQVIAGWDRGIQGMKVGGLRRLIVPPSLAYGSGRFGSIPGNSTLLFDVELLAVGTTPSITTNPTDVTVAVGETATFTAAAGGDPAPTAQWQVSTDGGTTWAEIAGATDATYSFVAAAADNGKQFRAVFSNGVGSAVTSSATLTVTSGGGGN